MNRSSTLLLLVACAQLFCGGPVASGQSIPTLDKIQEVWQARQDRIRSARFEWTETRLIPKHTMPPAGLLAAGQSGLPAEIQKEIAKGEPMPPDDLSLASRRTFSLNGAMMRYTREGQQWDPFGSQVLTTSYVATCDGEVAKKLFGNSPFIDRDGSTAPIPFAGFIEKTPRSADWNNCEELLPILLTARPCSVELGGRDLHGFRVSPRVATIDGHDYVMLIQEPKPKLRRLETFWLDSRREFIVVRALRSQTGLNRTFDISYDQDPSGAWLPTGWKSVSAGPGTGRIMEQVVVRIANRDINIKIPRSEFQIDFPVGAMVRDSRPAAAPAWYIVQAGGVKREITQAELRRGATYDQLISTESGMAAQEGRR
jgi:hypothetical protein